MRAQYLTLQEKSQILGDLLKLAKALEIAERGRWMAQEHAKNIWRYQLSVSGVDLTKEPGKEVK